jgi:hypothetical protein
MEQLQYYFFIFYHGVTWNYAYAVILILLLWFMFSEEVKDECKNLLASVNFSMGIALCLYAVDYVYCFADAASAQPKYEWDRPEYPGLFGPLSITFEIIKLAIGILLVFTYARHSWKLTILTVAVLSFPNLQQWIISFYRDYLPSSWSVSSEDLWFLRIRSLVVFISSVLLAYGGLLYLRLLPHPSRLFQSADTKADPNKILE